jgi:diamine N-acetyltransferase
MNGVVLREISPANIEQILALDVEPYQSGWVASNETSLALAEGDSSLYPLSIYPPGSAGASVDAIEPVGFTMYQIEAAVGFIERLMIDRRHQRKGHGRSAMLEVIRRLRLYPEVQLVATSYRHDNAAAAALYASLGFTPWSVTGAKGPGGEVYVAIQQSTP